MNIATVSLASRLRTWLLVAGLTALLVAIGTVVGGDLLYVFAALAVFLNLLGYWFSDRVALAASRAKPLPQHEAPELRGMVAELAARAGVPVPRLYLIPSEQPNAFATVRKQHHAGGAGGVSAERRAVAPDGRRPRLGPTQETLADRHPT
jgi:heat shock protein HtpX